ncbi:hypothetical protein L21_2492 [Methanoculleus chikugoensis]|jgi:hypothetical protein|uniref:Uncharacterized protein n=1 Tax=Methanoculleus chikugoensis TaxID=118126 RepID=A0A1M4MP42_9EURY|nr:hypothetical protein [Methanoculleus chikugoensis]NMA09583.1 hypothetical protein [Methanomicrobiales archaeon]SCL76558.1 hypothetical protein L21_2492 [Methanoculleus chikugoensis]
MRQRDREGHAERDIARGSLTVVTGIALFVYREVYLILVTRFFARVVVTLLRVVREKGIYRRASGTRPVCSPVLGLLAVTLPR